MATLTNAHPTWAGTQTQNTNTNIWSKWQAFADSQKNNKTFWFLLSPMFQGVFFLPLPAVLTFYFNAPVYILAVTLVLFFVNIIAGMGGSSIRAVLTLLASSVIINIALLLIYAIF